MSTKIYIFYYILILIFLISFQHFNAYLYSKFTLLIYTYALTNLFLQKCNYYFS